MLIFAFLVIQNGHSLTLKTGNQAQHLNWLDFVYHSQYLYVVCYMCGDSDGGRC